MYVTAQVFTICPLACFYFITPSSCPLQGQYTGDEEYSQVYRPTIQDFFPATICIVEWFWLVLGQLFVANWTVSAFITTYTHAFKFTTVCLLSLRIRSRWRNYLPPFPSFDYETDKANVAVRWGQMGETWREKACTFTPLRRWTGARDLQGGETDRHWNKQRIREH